MLYKWKYKWKLICSQRVALLSITSSEWARARIVQIVHLSARRDTDNSNTFTPPCFCARDIFENFPRRDHFVAARVKNCSWSMIPVIIPRLAELKCSHELSSFLQRSRNFVSIIGQLITYARPNQMHCNWDAPRATVGAARINCDYTKPHSRGRGGAATVRRIRRNEKQLYLFLNLINIDHAPQYRRRFAPFSFFFFICRKYNHGGLRILTRRATMSIFSSLNSLSDTLSRSHIRRYNRAYIYIYIYIRRTDNRAK